MRLARAEGPEHLPLPEEGEAPPLPELQDEGGAAGLEEYGESARDASDVPHPLAIDVLAKVEECLFSRALGAGLEEPAARGCLLPRKEVQAPALGREVEPQLLALAKVEDDHLAGEATGSREAGPTHRGTDLLEEAVERRSVQGPSPFSP
jgi:hypothetical protein